jgi:hypothetical protein
MGWRLSSEALQFHLTNRISVSPESLLHEVVELAQQIANISLDAVFFQTKGDQGGMVWRVRRRLQSRSAGREEFDGE